MILSRIALRNQTRRSLSSISSSASSNSRVAVASETAELATRPQVLQLYKKILKCAKTWQNEEEAEYIRMEARSLFQQNKSVRDPAEIHSKIFEAESRYELALHYKIPYPRYYNVQPRATIKVRPSRSSSGKYVRAAYMDSLYTTPKS